MAPTLQKNSGMDYPSLFQEVNDKIISGQAQLARVQIEQLILKKVPREYLPQFANLARRCGKDLLALKSLHQIIYPTDNMHEPASDKEKLEYAATLIKLGMNVEGLQLADSIDTQKAPSILLHSAFALFTQWNYEDAIPILEFYLDNFKLDPYPELVAKVNLASAYVTTNKYEKARALLDFLINETKEQNKLLLHVNCLEMSAQLSTRNRFTQAAEEDLEKAKKYVKSTSPVTQLLLKKWQVINQLEQNTKAGQKPNPSKIKALRRIKERAIEIKNWETVRHCDLYLAKYLRNVPLTRYLYYGSPSASFRNYIVDEISNDIVKEALEAKKIIYPYRGPTTAVFNLEETQIWKEKTLVSQTLRTLFDDFYRQLRTYEIFDRLYSDEKFNPLSSPNKIHQLMNRLKESLEIQAVPLSIQCKNNFYEINCPKDQSLSLSLDL